MSDETFRDPLRAAAVVAYVDKLRRERDEARAKRCECGADEACEYLRRAESAEARIAEVERACGMPLHMISTTLDAHRNTAEADHQRAEAAERALITAQGQVSALTASLNREVKARAEAERAAWCAGRDAALSVVRRHDRVTNGLIDEIRALTPPRAEDTKGEK